MREKVKDRSEGNEIRVNVRELALDTLMEICEHDAYSHQVLRAVLDKHGYLDKQRRAFLTRLVEGTLERRIELDYTIDLYSKVKVDRQKPLIRTLLRLSAYQLRYMDAVPDSAVCNEAVKLAKKRGFARLSGFVNGVLRSIARGGDPLKRLKRGDDPLKRLKRGDDPAGYLEIVYSTPRWIVEQWLSEYGCERTEEILASFFREQPLVVRTNRSKCTPGQLRERLESEDVQTTAVEGVDYAYELWGVDRLSSLGSFRDGWFYVQDVTSMMVAERAMDWLHEQGDENKTLESAEDENKTLESAEDGIYVIDVCAAPGGKSTHLAEALGGRGFVEARDLTEAKVDLIRENIQMLGLENIRTVRQDATVRDDRSVAMADILICDLPCSGLGVMGKKTDIRYRMTPEKQGQLVRLQREILTAVVDYVKPGGLLLYSTCTISRAENEENVAWLLEQQPKLHLCRQVQLLPGQRYHDGFFLAEIEIEDRSPKGPDAG